MDRVAPMIALGLGLAGPACRMSLDEEPAMFVTADAPTSPACLAAEGHADFNFIETKIFSKSCIFSGCHNGAATDAGKIDLRDGKAHASLVNVASEIDTRFKLVTPSAPNKSYLMVMIKHIPEDMMDPSPAIGPDLPEPGYMPQSSNFRPLCVEKREAIERWIAAGALDN
jgi:hypothetical protein